MMETFILLGIIVVTLFMLKRMLTRYGVNRKRYQDLDKNLKDYFDLSEESWKK